MNFEMMESEIVKTIKVLTLKRSIVKQIPLVYKITPEQFSTTQRFAWFSLGALDRDQVYDQAILIIDGSPVRININHHVWGVAFITWLRSAPHVYLD